MATANLTDNGNILLQDKFRTLARYAKLVGTKTTGNAAWSITNDEDPISWTGASATPGITNQEVISFFIPISAADGFYSVEGIELLDSINRTLISDDLPAGESSPTYSYYANGAATPAGTTIRDGNSGKYTLSLIQVTFST